MQDAPHDRIAMRLHSVAVRLLRRVRQDDTRTMGLTPARASLLSILVFGGPQSIGQLAAAEQVAFPTISKLVNGLEAEGLVRRAPDATDGRVTTVLATPGGRRLMKRGRARRLKHLQELLEALPPDRWVTLEETVTLLESALSRGARSRS